MISHFRRSEIRVPVWWSSTSQRFDMSTAQTDKSIDVEVPRLRQDIEMFEDGVLRRSELRSCRRHMFVSLSRVSPSLAHLLIIFSFYSWHSICNRYRAITAAQENGIPVHLSLPGRIKRIISVKRHPSSSPRQVLGAFTAKIARKWDGRWLHTSAARVLSNSHKAASIPPKQRISARGDVERRRQGRRKKVFVGRLRHWHIQTTIKHAICTFVFHLKDEISFFESSTRISIRVMRRILLISSET